MLCITEFGIGVGRVIADPYTRLLYSSTPEDVAAIQQLRQQGLSQDEAIRHLMQARRNRSQ